MMAKISIETKNAWRKKATKQLNTDLDKDFAEELSAALKEKGWSKAEFLRRAARELLGVDTEIESK